MERVAYLGGSFDPPHRGHLAMAEAAGRAVGLDQVLLVPTGLQPFKQNGAAASYEDRLRMVELLCGDADATGLQGSRLDAPMADGSPNYTVDALARLARERPGARLYGVVGADTFPEMAHWRAAERLMAMAEWIVISRPGWSWPEPLPPVLRAARVHRVDDVAVPIASRVLRARLRDGDSCAEAIPPAVLGYIRKRGLYGVGMEA